MANLPLAQASAMGSNALVLILLDDIAFILLTVTGLRKKIFEAIPRAVRVAVPAGIGLFIAFIGLQDSGLVVADPATYVNFASFDLLSGNVSWGDIMPLLVTFSTLIVIAVLTCKGIKGAVLCAGRCGAGFQRLGAKTLAQEKRITLCGHTERGNHLDEVKGEEVTRSKQ